MYGYSVPLRSTPIALFEVWHRWRAWRTALGARCSTCARSATATTATALDVCATRRDVAACLRIVRVPAVTSVACICAITTTASASGISVAAAARVAASTRVGAVARISTAIATIAGCNIAVHFAIGTTLHLVAGCALATTDGLHFCCAAEAGELLLLQRGWRRARAAHTRAETGAAASILACACATTTALTATATTLSCARVSGCGVIDRLVLCRRTHRAEWLLRNTITTTEARGFFELLLRTQTDRFKNLECLGFVE